MSPRTLSLVILAVLAPLAPPRLQAQEWAIDLQAGQATYPSVAADVGASNAMLGVRYAGLSGTWFYLTAAAPLSGEDPVWGAVGAGRRLSTLVGTRTRIGIDLGAQGHGYKDPIADLGGSGFTLEALPLVVLRHGPARVEAYSGLSHYASSYGTERTSRDLHDSGLRLSVRAGGGVELGGELRYARAEEDDYPYAGGSVTYDFARGTVWAHGGRWLSDALPDAAYGAGASFQIGARTDLWAAYARESSDPLYWNDTRSSWSFGVSRRLGRGPEGAAPVRPRIEGNAVTIRIPRSEAAAAPFIAGDFTDWRPVRMRHAGAFWQIRLTIDSGVHHYAFRTADGRWFVPKSVPGRTDDGMGGHTAVLVIP